MTVPNAVSTRTRALPEPIKSFERPAQPDPNTLPATVAETFPPLYIKANNLPPEGVTVSIRAHTWKWLMPNPPMWELKKVLYFSFKAVDGSLKPARKGLIINKTSAKAITQIAQSEAYDDWVGVMIHLTPGRTKGGKPTILINPPVLSNA